MKIVPFYANTKDDTHCYQAALRMVLKHFLPRRNFTYKILDAMTGHKRGLWTWQTLGMLSLNALGLRVCTIEQFDYRAFASGGERHLLEYYGAGVGSEQIRLSDVPQEQQAARDFVHSGIPHENRIPTQGDIRHLLDDGWLVVCNVNAKMLNRKKGYIGHFVVLFGYTGNAVYLHDPGLPPHKNRKVTWRVFDQAWGFPDQNAKNIYAFTV